jgi:protein-L-isoaspartate(D-aspartate) O-methyltransferase
MDPHELEVVRRAYAKQILAAAGVEDPRLESSYAKVRREDFLGPGPWQIVRWGRCYVETPSADPVYLYTDDVVGILPERNLNNGQPSLHAMLIASAAPQPGEHAVHVGAGVGYYTALLADLVGAQGFVTAIEFDPTLAARAAGNFSRVANVAVVQGDGAVVDFDPADVIYVNAGATRPAEAWLERLKDGGRMILPLTTNQGFRANDPQNIRRRGAVFRIEWRGEEFAARWISPVAIFPCEGAREPASEAALAVAFQTERWREVTRLYRRDDLPSEQCWLRAPGWSLAYY